MTDTAEYARVLFAGETPDDSEKTPKKGKNDASSSGSKKDRVENRPQAGETRKTAWIPSDYLAVAPASLADTVRAHRGHYQAIGNPAGKCLYAIYVVAAVPASIVLNVVSLAAAHASVAINEPARIRSALLGVVFLALIVGGVVWASV